MRPLAAGRDADVFGLSGGRVLRRLRHGVVAEHEVDVMRHVAAAGYPVPRVHDVDGGDIVMDRLDGPTMGAAMGTGSVAEHAMWPTRSPCSPPYLRPPFRSRGSRRCARC